ncbi:MAG: ATP-binding protein [Clostridia bacterium]|nr:ATP-binding protein [Clostridia bacterium]
MGTIKVFKCSIRSGVDNICPAVKEVIRYLEDIYGLIDDSSVFELKVILSELISNAVKHGNRENYNKEVKVRAGVTNDGKVFISVEDEGEGHDYNTFAMKASMSAHQECDIFDMKETGRGILIVNKLCDRVKFNKKGNKVVILKSLH